MRKIVATITLAGALAVGGIPPAVANHEPAASCLNRQYDRIRGFDDSGTFTGTDERECFYENQIGSSHLINTWYLQGGNDGALAGPDDDWVEGQTGNDWLWGEWGSDFLFGGGGDDRLHEGNGGAHDHIIGGPGNDTVYCGHGEDLCHDTSPSTGDVIFHCHDGIEDSTTGFETHHHDHTC